MEENTWAYSSGGLERTPDKREVPGSSPGRPTRKAQNSNPKTQIVWILDFGFWIF